MFQAEPIAGTDFERTWACAIVFGCRFRKYEFTTAMSPAHAARNSSGVRRAAAQVGWPTSSKRGYFEGKVAGQPFQIPSHRRIPELVPPDNRRKPSGATPWERWVKP